ncbi:MAG: TauD/TfdA family dioxygenase [Proteobacteria bacterium]|nr:TauD/TfdA family dioxygenase [Pseudomonadota bacterium]
MAIRVTPLSGHTGAAISGVDLSRPLADADFARIRRALLDHVVFVISGLAPEFQALLDFGRRFGRLVPHVLTQYHHPETPEVSVISNVVDSGQGRTTGMPAGAFWHSDLSYDVRPSAATLLYSVEVPESGGDTLFANMYRAYETLPEPTKRRIEGLSAVHRYGWNGGAAVVALSEEQRAAHPDVVHPMVRVHPETGRKVLFVNPGFTMKIAGMDEDESRALLDELFDHARRPEFQYRHTWRAGQIVACDNRASMHCATGGYGAARRTLWRMIVGGTEAGRVAGDL